jgi:hypothetical protein
MIEVQASANQRDEEMVEFHTTLKTGRTIVWGMAHMDLFDSGHKLIYDKLRNGETVTLEIKELVI